jgi:DNA polymerase III epsilon subunit-like protein
MRIFFFDTETTGNTATDVLCQLAVKERGVAEPVVNALYKPHCDIPYECSMIHHITNKMVVDRPAFSSSPEYIEIKSLFESPETICVAHNSSFDVQILKNDGIDPTNVICTFKAIRQLDTTGKFPMHKLQYLRYALDMELDVPAHDAFADVLVLEQLFDYELALAMAEWKLSETDALERMIALTKEPLTFRNFDFGKYKGKAISEVAASDPGYLSWLLDQKKKSDADERDWIYTLEKHLGLTV